MSLRPCQYCGEQDRIQYLCVHKGSRKDAYVAECKECGNLIAVAVPSMGSGFALVEAAWNADTVFTAWQQSVAPLLDDFLKYPKADLAWAMYQRGWLAAGGK